MNSLKTTLALLLLLITTIGCSSEEPSATATASATPTATASATPTATASATPLPALTPIPTAAPIPELIPEITIENTSLTAQISPPGNSVIEKEPYETSDEIDPSKCAQVTDSGLCLLFVELYFSSVGQLIEVLQATDGEEIPVDPSSWFPMSDRQAFIPLSLRFGHDYVITFLIGDTNEGITGSASVQYFVR